MCPADQVAFSFCAQPGCVDSQWRRSSHQPLNAAAGRQGWVAVTFCMRWFPLPQAIEAPELVLQPKNAGGTQGFCKDTPQRHRLAQGKVSHHHSSITLSLLPTVYMIKAASQLWYLNCERNSAPVSLWRSKVSIGAPGAFLLLNKKKLSSLETKAGFSTSKLAKNSNPCCLQACSWLTMKGLPGRDLTSRCSPLRMIILD